MAASDLPFTHDMVVVHRAFRRAFGEGPRWVRRVAPGDTSQAAVVVDYLDRVFDTLHHHHEAEDVELWPRLRQRAADQATLLDLMEAQHAGIDPSLATARSLGRRWVATGDSADRDAFADSLEEAGTAIVEHLDTEESDILPLAQEHLSEQEWGLLADHAVAHIPKRDLLTGMGAMFEDATPDERAMMLQTLPAMAKVLYRVFGRRAYIKQATAVRGTPPVGL